MADRADLSQFLIHLTKEGTFKRLVAATGLPPSFRESHVTVKAKLSLEGILQNKRIEARSSFGYYALKINKQTYSNRSGKWQNYNNGGADPAWTQCVCFSETPIAELQGFYQTTQNKRNQYGKYGLAFWQDKARLAGANPIFYVDSDRAISSKVNYLPALDSVLGQTSFVPLMHLIETFGPSVIAAAKTRSDFRWEREWRMHGTFAFNWSDVAFGICPDSERTHFEAMAIAAGGNTIFVDPDWSPSQLKSHLQSRSPRLAACF